MAFISVGSIAMKIISVEGGVVEGDCSPFQLGRNLLHSGNFPERTIGNSSNFSDFPLLIRAEMLQPP